MGTGKTRKAATRNVGRGSQKVGRGKESGAAGQVSYTSAFYSLLRALADFESNRANQATFEWLMEQVNRSFGRNPQTFRSYPDRIHPEAYTAGAYSVALYSRMEAAAEAIDRGCAFTGAGGPFYLSYRPARKQRT